MKYFILIISLLFPLHLTAQWATNVSTPQHLVVDSHDNIFVTRQYGMAKIAPDGTAIDLSKKVAQGKGLDRAWHALIIDSKDNLYAHDGNMIYKIRVSDDNVVTMTRFAGQDGYKLLDGPLSIAAFNTIGHMAIDRSDNIYLTDSYDKIKDQIGTNFVTDSYYLDDPAKKYLKYPGRNYSIVRKISSGGIVSTLKTPDGKYVLPNKVNGMTIDLDGNIIFTSQSFGRFVGKIDISSGAIMLVAGLPYKREWCPVYTQGDISRAEFVEPQTVIVNKKGEILVADERINRIMKIANGKVSTLAGGNIIDPCSQNIGGRSQEGNRDGKAFTALFNFPKGMAYDSKGNLFIADMNNHSVRKLSPDGIVSTFAK